jgi:excisionase family DNA binding protein
MVSSADCGRFSGKGESVGKDSPIINRLISVKEVAVYTGLAPDTLYTMVSQRRIPFVKVGRLTKFDLGLLDAWIKQRTVMPMPTKSA